MTPNPDINDFSWDSLNQELGQQTVEQDVEPIPTQDPQPTPEVIKEEEKPIEESVEPKKEEKPEEVVDSTNDSDAQTLYEDFKNLGMIKYMEFNEDTPITQESLVELMQADREEEMRLQLENFFNELDPRLKPIVTYVQNGGNLDEYFNVSASEFDFNRDIKDENYQTDLIRYYEKTVLGNTDDEINDLLTLLQTGDKKLARATKYQSLLKQAHEQQEQALQQEQQQRAAEAKQAYENDVNNVTTALKKDNVLGLKLSPKDRTELQNFIVNKNIQLQDGTRATSFQWELHKALQDIDKRILIAQLIKDDFKLDKIAKNYTTEKTQLFRARVKQQKESLENDNSSQNPFSSMNNQLT